MHLHVQIFRVDCAEVELVLPCSGIMLAFRCSSRKLPIPENLEEFPPFQPNNAMHEPIQVSVGTRESARRIAAKAIAEYRTEYVRREHRWYRAVQTSFSFH